MEHYVELDLIGKGTYGKCFKVKSKADDEIYVVKKVQFDGTPQSEAEAALREGQVLSLLRHPHVVPYKEFFKHTDGDLCLVMAFCEGGDLFRYIRELRKQGRTVPEPQVWQWLVQLLLSLSYIHAKRILHRDVKTQNIFLSEGKVLLGDFGLAKQLQRTFEMARTPIGTPYYMAPEIYEEQPYSFKSDVWALGCVMYEMLTGKAAFAADNLSKVVLRVIRGQYDPLPESYSSALRTVVTSMLCKDVKARPDANTLLTVPAVVPHVQRYLEALTAEGPTGWATWRMKLPMAAMVQMSEVLEAAGVPQPRRSQAGGAGSRAGSARPSYNGLAGTGGMGGALLGTAPLPPPPLQQQLVMSQRERDRERGREPQAVLVDETLLPESRIHTEASPGQGEPASPAPPATPDPGASKPGPNGQVVKLPPLPGSRLPPIRTPYGLATPFMAGVFAQAPLYAELQLLAHQVMAIRSSQCGEAEGEGQQGSSTLGPGRVGAGIGVRGGCAEDEEDSEEEEVSGALPTAAGGLGVGGARGGGGREEHEVVKALDRTLIKTLEVARKAAAETAAKSGDKGNGGGGGTGGGNIDEAWLSAGLPQGGFGFATERAPSRGGDPSHHSHSQTHSHSPSSHGHASLHPYSPASNCSTPHAGHPALVRTPAQPKDSWGSQRVVDREVLQSPRAPVREAFATHTRESYSRESHSREGREFTRESHSREGRDYPRESHSREGRETPRESYSREGRDARDMGFRDPFKEGHPHHSKQLSQPAAQPSTPSPAVPLFARARSAKYAVEDDGFASLGMISLNTQSFTNRRQNLQANIAAKLGPALTAKVMEAVHDVQRLQGGAGDMLSAERHLRARLDSLLAGDPAARRELGPLIEEMALLHV